MKAATIYYDTNVLAYLNAGEIADFLAGFSSRGAKHVTSDTAIAELIDGERTEILSRHIFLYVRSHEPLFLNGTVNFYKKIKLDDELEYTNDLEIFLRALLRSASGSSSVMDINSLFADGLKGVIDAIIQELPEDSDARLVSQLTQARENLFAGIALLPDPPSPLFSDEEMDALKVGPRYLGNVKPPHVVEKIVKMYPDTSPWLEQATSPLKEDEDIRSRIQELSLALIIIGFARDKSLAKDDEKKSDSGAQAQFRDISHICAGAVCDIFITADKRCARLAYAVFEALKLRACVLHLIRGKPNEVSFGEVGPSYWP